jgi:hypothetical protein
MRTIIVVFVLAPITIPSGLFGRRVDQRKYRPSGCPGCCDLSCSARSQARLGAPEVRFDPPRPRPVGEGASLRGMGDLMLKMAGLMIATELAQGSLVVEAKLRNFSVSA